MSLGDDGSLGGGTTDSGGTLMRISLQVVQTPAPYR
jgi:hypothetical protein